MRQTPFARRSRFASASRDYPAATEYQEGLAWAYVDLALAHRQRGQHAEALALFRKTVSLRETLVHDHPENREVQK